MSNNIAHRRKLEASYDSSSDSSDSLDSSDSSDSSDDGKASNAVVNLTYKRKANESIKQEAPPKKKQKRQSDAVSDADEWEMYIPIVILKEFDRPFVIPPESPEPIKLQYEQFLWTF